MYNLLAMVLGLLLVVDAFGGAYRTSFLVDKVAGRKMLRFMRWIYTLIVGYLLWCATAYALLNALFAICDHWGNCRAGDF